MRAARRRPAAGLDAAEVERRRAEYGPNKLAEEAKEPGWKAFLRQYRDLMQLVLLGAAVVSIVALQEVSTGLVVIGLTVLNAVMGLHQEGKAAESVAALRKMLMIRRTSAAAAQLRRDPGRGARAGRHRRLRGRRQGAGRRPAAGGGDARDRGGGADRREHAGAEGRRSGRRRRRPARRPGRHGVHELAVTRGRGEMVVTATGMATEVGHISGMLSGVEQEKTPLTKQLDQLTVLITIMAAAALALIVIIGLIRGEDFDELFLVGISLAIAAIPTGLPAVVTTLLSLGHAGARGEGRDRQAAAVGGDARRRRRRSAPTRPGR